MENPLARKAWSPYVVGAGIGVLSWFTFASVNKPIGITTAFEYTSALAEEAATPGVTKAYLEDKAKEDKRPRIDWEWMLVLGVFLGAYASAKVSGDRAPQEAVPALWRRRFGERPALRLAGAFAGGFVMMLGARIAQGCTSGHMISGNLQLALSSWVFTVVAGAAALATAFMLYGKEGRSHV